MLSSICHLARRPEWYCITVMNGRLCIKRPLRDATALYSVHRTKWTSPVRPRALPQTCGLSRCKRPEALRRPRRDHHWIFSPNFFSLLCSLFHVGVHLREVVLHDVVGGAVGNGSKAKGRLDGAGVCQTAILESDQIGKFLPERREAALSIIVVAEEVLAVVDTLAS